MKAQFSMGTALMTMLLSAVANNGPKFGRRFLCGQARCTEIGALRDGANVLIDRSEVRNATAGKYMPHQGKREMGRRRARGW